MSQTIRTAVNGKLVEVDANATAAQLKRAAGARDSDSLVRINGHKAEIVPEAANVQPGGKYRSIPPVTQGVA